MKLLEHTPLNQIQLEALVVLAATIAVGLHLGLPPALTAYCSIMGGVFWVVYRTLEEWQSGDEADESEMTVEEALFEYAAAWADAQERIRYGDDAEQVVEDVEASYDLDVADAVLEREGITRSSDSAEDFTPYSVRTMNQSGEVEG